MQDRGRERETDEGERLQLRLCTIYKSPATLPAVAPARSIQAPYPDPAVKARSRCHEKLTIVYGIQVWFT